MHLSQPVTVEENVDPSDAGTRQYPALDRQPAGHQRDCDAVHDRWTVKLKPEFFQFRCSGSITE